MNSEFDNLHSRGASNYNREEDWYVHWIEVEEPDIIEHAGPMSLDDARTMETRKNFDTSVLRVWINLSPF